MVQEGFLACLVYIAQVFIESVFNHLLSLVYILFTTSFASNDIYYIRASAVNVHRRILHACGMVCDFSSFVLDLTVFAKEFVA